MLVRDVERLRPGRRLEQLGVRCGGPLREGSGEAALRLPELGEVDAEVTDIVEASVEFAKNGTDPAPEDALKNIYA